MTLTINMSLEGTPANLRINDKFTTDPDYKHLLTPEFVNVLHAKGGQALVSDIYDDASLKASDVENIIIVAKKFDLDETQIRDLKTFALDGGTGKSLDAFLGSPVIVNNYASVYKATQFTPQASQEMQDLNAQRNQEVANHEKQKLAFAKLAANHPVRAKLPEVIATHQTKVSNINQTLATKYGVKPNQTPEDVVREHVEAKAIEVKEEIETLPSFKQKVEDDLNANPNAFYNTITGSVAGGRRKRTQPRTPTKSLQTRSVAKAPGQASGSQTTQSTAGPNFTPQAQTKANNLGLDLSKYSNLTPKEQQSLANNLNKAVNSRNGSKPYKAAIRQLNILKPKLK